MASMQEESEEDDTEASNERTYEGTSKGVSRERNCTSHKVIFVDNLPSSMDKNGFIDLFCDYGSIVDFKFLKHKTGAETGYGFVEFRDNEDGRKAIHNMNWKLIEQRHIRVTRAKPSTKILSMTNLYVENLPKSWNDKTITSYFSKVCKITHARVLVNRKNGQSRGVGFVHCSSNDHAKKAIHRVNVKNRGEEGDLNLFVTFAKVSKAERRVQRPVGGNHGNQEGPKWVSRQYQAHNRYQEHYRTGIADHCKTLTQSYRGRCHYNQRQHQSGSRNSKFNLNPNSRKKYVKRQYKVSNNNGIQYVNRKTVVDVKESGHQKHNLFMPSHIPIQSNSQVLTQVPIQGMIVPAWQHTYYRDQEMMNTGVSPKINPIAPGLQIQFSPGIKQQTNSEYMQAAVGQNWLSEQQLEQCLLSGKWPNGNFADHLVGNDAISKVFDGKALYPDNTCIITPVLSNQTGDLYQWSPLLTPVGGTLVSVASHVPFYRNPIGSPRGIPTYFQGSSNQIVSPRTPRMLACSKFQSTNGRAQPNTIYWPPSPQTVNQTFSLASPFTHQQEMPNFSPNGGSPPHMNWRLQEKEPRSRSNKFAFPACSSVALHISGNKTSDYAPAEAKWRLIAASASEESIENHSKMRQNAREEKQLSAEICKVSAPAVPLRPTTQSSWHGLQSSLTTQPISIAQCTNHISTEQVPIPIYPRSIYSQ